MDHAFSIASLLEAENQKFLNNCNTTNDNANDNVDNKVYYDNNSYKFTDIHCISKNVFKSASTPDIQDELNMYLQSENQFTSSSSCTTTTTSILNTLITPTTSISHSFLHHKLYQDIYKDLCQSSESIYAQQVNNSDEIADENSHEEDSNTIVNYSPLKTFNWALTGQYENSTNIDINNNNNIHRPEYILCKNQLTHWFNQVNKIRHEQNINSNANTITTSQSIDANNNNNNLNQSLIKKLSANDPHLSRDIKSSYSSNSNIPETMNTTNSYKSSSISSKKSDKSGKISKHPINETQSDNSSDKNSNANQILQSQIHWYNSNLIK
ncbi:unnamed protein product, partial [Trichobilharzia regenti]